MAIAAPNPNTTVVTAPGSGQSYGAPLATVTTLFFMWGFLTCLNDILVPHLKSIFDLNYKQSQFIQLAFFGAYFVFSFPASKLVDWIGYQKSMVVGLVTAGIGAFLFVPAALVPSYPLFLGAFIVLAAGITCLQVAANPYVANLGPPETSAARLNLSQAFNSFGTFVAPFFGSMFILASAPVAPEKLRSFSAAAEQLGLSKATVSKAVSRVATAMSSTKPGSLAPVLKTVERALTATRPAPRYVVGRDAKAVTAIVRRLPTRTRDRAIMRTMDLRADAFPDN